MTGSDGRVAWPSTVEAPSKKPTRNVKAKNSETRFERKSGREKIDKGIGNESAYGERGIIY